MSNLQTTVPLWLDQNVVESWKDTEDLSDDRELYPCVDLARPSASLFGTFGSYLSR